ncbi:hypothetical protein GCM10027269_82300 [Kribbella endophytica]
MLGDRSQQVGRIADRLDELHLVGLGEQGGNAFAHEKVVLREHDPQRHPTTLGAPSTPARRVAGKQEGWLW